MSLPAIEKLLIELKEQIDSLDTRFVAPHIPADPATSQKDLEHDVRAFCVLCHAAFEEFFESTALILAKFAAEQWKTARKANDVIIALLSWHGSKLKIDEDEKNPEKKPFDYLRELVNEAKTAFSREIHNNHGTSIIYLRNLLIPVAIEIKQDPNILNSLKQLALSRGDYAHKWRAKTFVAPEDARGYVRDVILLCEHVKEKAKNHITQLT